ncbi:probable N-acetyltransferase camello [Anneissia japonica]|uniref:probable N-acetyltransferase camello n=1 Tax=Anneissia japonica TaxID=1529436 RepID=UPI00142596AA|nr:probable N-acetyltransferase camello [Anneissia japonica]
MDERRNTMGVTITSAENKDFLACANLFKHVFLEEHKPNFFLRCIRKLRYQVVFLAIVIVVYGLSASVTLTLISLCISLYVFFVYLHREVSAYVSKQQDILDIGKYYAGDRSNYWVAKSVDGLIVGTVAILETDDKEIAELKRLVVKREFQSHGLGIKLVDHALKFCQEARYKEVKLECSECLQRALNLYRKLGFSVVPYEEKGCPVIKYECRKLINRYN